jgi:hypothetical protein
VVLLSTPNVSVVIAADEQLDLNGADAGQPEAFSEIRNTNTEKHHQEQPLRMKS